MGKERKGMSRRQFLLSANYVLFGGLFGIHSFSNANACDGREGCAHIQPHIALIIDDIGYSPSRAKLFLDLKIPLTFSILPRLSHTNDLAPRIYDKGHEIMLHQPMEPYNPGIDPGPGALFVGDDPERIVSILEENISSIPFAKGVNNHMGSRFTECRHEMNETLTVIKTQNLFFVDSLTTSHSIAYKIAKRLQIITAFRNIFLDTNLAESYILSQLHRLKRHAFKYGSAIAIGHPHVVTARAIRKFMERHKELRRCLVYISDILRARNLKSGSSYSSV